MIGVSRLSPVEISRRNMHGVSKSATPLSCFLLSHDTYFLKNSQFLLSEWILSDDSTNSKKFVQSIFPFPYALYVV